MRKTALIVAAIILGYFSPWMASADNGTILFLWFNWLPTLAALWLDPQGEAAALALDVGVLAVQYLWLFILIADLGKLARIGADFLSGPKHRSGLVR
jgi:hypothetical protein